MPLKAPLKYHRVLLKLGGELFGNKHNHGISFPAYHRIAQDLIKIIKKNGIQLSIVIGGGNIFRGKLAQGQKIDPAVADYMGMLATIINGLALQDALEQREIPTRMMTAIEMKAIAEPYLRRRALHHLNKNRIAIYTAGIGSPFFTSDTAAALRACETNCDLILKATNVDGVYSDDPHQNHQAQRYSHLTYQQALEKHLQIMDATAFALCRKRHIPIIVFHVQDLDQISNIVRGKRIGTLISD